MHKCRAGSFDSSSIHFNSNTAPVTAISFSSIVLKLLKPMVLEKGQRFTLRVSSMTVGTGVVTEVMAKLSEKERMSLVDSKKKREKALAEEAAGGKK